MIDDDATYLGISRLHAVYADVSTRMAWDEMRAIVTPDACFTFDLGSGPPVSLTGPAELAAFGSKATAGFSFYSYQPLNAVLTSSEASAAAGRFWSLEIGVDRASGDWLEFYGRYADEYVLADDGWKYTRRAFQVLERRVNGAHA